MRAGAALLAAILLAGCVTAPQYLGRSNLDDLPGWGAENHAAAFSAFRSTCYVAHDPAMGEACAAAQSAGRLDERGGRAFFENRFRAEPINGEGVLTAYFSPVYDARAHRDGEFSAPVRPRPADAAESPPRAEIEQLPAPDALAWMRPEDLFFLQIQGSGALVFADGHRLKAAFAASNNQPFVGIAAPMTQRGLLTSGGSTSSAVHDWLADHRGPQADAVMRLDPRYIYFKLLPDDGREPQGAAGAPLVPGRSVAVDPSRHAMGELLWADADDAALAGARPAYQRLVLALDTGGAIKGAVRADLYLGRGDAAGEEAGRVRHHLRLWRLLPTSPR